MSHHNDDEYFKTQDDEWKTKMKIIKALSKKLEKQSLGDVERVRKIVSNIDNIETCLNLFIER